MLSNLVAIDPDIEFLEKQTKNTTRFNMIDYHIITREKSREKIFRQFSRTPFIFNAYVLMGSNLGPTVGTRSIVIESSRVLSLVNDILQRDIQTPNEINMIYVGNVTALNNKLSLNGWTLAHRIGHALTTCKNANQCMINLHDKVVLTELVMLYNRLLKRYTPAERYYYRKFEPITDYVVDPFDRKFDNVAKFSNMILTMKSARDKRISNPVDISAECIAQYIINGSVHLNRAENCDITQIIDNRPKDYFIEMDPDVFNPLIEEAERKINEVCHTVLSNVVGKVICF